MRVCKYVSDLCVHVHEFTTCTVREHILYTYSVCQYISCFLYTMSMNLQSYYSTPYTLDPGLGYRVWNSKIQGLGFRVSGQVTVNHTSTIRVSGSGGWSKTTRFEHLGVSTGTLPVSVCLLPVPVSTLSCTPFHRYPTINSQRFALFDSTFSVRFN